MLVCGRHELPRARERREDGTTQDLLPVVRRGGRPPHRVRARLAGAVHQLAASAALLRRSRVPGGGSGHARLWPLQRVRAPRGLRAGAQRQGHARAAGCAGSGKGHLGGPRLGKPRGVEPGQPSSRAVLRRSQPLRALFREGFCPQYLDSAGGSLSLPAGAISGRPMGVSALLRGELRRGTQQASRPMSGTPSRPCSGRGAPAPRASCLAPPRSATTPAGSGERVRPPTCHGTRTCSQKRICTGTRPPSRATGSSGRIPGT